MALLDAVPLTAMSQSGIAYAIRGSGEPVLFIPPAGTSSAIWSYYQVPAVLSAGYRAITIDLPGTPPSKTLPKSYRLQDFTVDAIEFMEELGVPSCHVVGASLGAMIAQELAVARPNLVLSLALLGTRSRTDFFRKAIAHAAEERASVDGPVTQLDAVAQLTQLFSAKTLADDRVAADWHAVFSHFLPRGPGPAAQYRASVAADSTVRLADIQCPCLVVSFAEDLITPPALCREVASAIRGAELVEVSDAGHFGFLENPIMVNEILLNFLSEKSVRRGLEGCHVT